MARRSEDGLLELSNAREDSFLVVKDCRITEINRKQYHCHNQRLY